MTKRKLLGMAVVTATVFGAWQLRGDDAPAAGDEDLVTDRMWISHLPRDRRDEVDVFLTVTDESFGLFQSGSQWRGKYELFQFERHGSQLRIVYPQTGDREQVTAKATRCDERGMHYCLELTGATRGVKKYYSMKGWEIDGSIDAARAKADALRAAK